MRLMQPHSISLSESQAAKSVLLGRKQPLVLSTKVVPPRCPGLIDRPRPLALASKLPAKRRALIKAPAGFGKTSLALTWAEWLHQHGSSVAWLATDPDHNERLRFLFSVAQAMERASRRR
jgi:LuxR family maltose regulon positive regulatory protein